LHNEWSKSAEVTHLAAYFWKPDCKTVITTERINHLAIKPITKVIYKSVKEFGRTNHIIASKSIICR